MTGQKETAAIATPHLEDIGEIRSGCAGFTNGGRPARPPGAGSQLAKGGVREHHLC